MSDNIWNLIQNMAETMCICDRMTSIPGSSDAVPEEHALVDTLNRIQAAERDHINALEYLYAQLTKVKPESEITGFAKSVLADYREQARIIK